MLPSAVMIYLKLLILSVFALSHLTQFLLLFGGKCSGVSAPIKAASSHASEIVGCAWIVSAMHSTVNSLAITTAISAIKVAASCRPPGRRALVLCVCRGQSVRTLRFVM